MFIVVYCTRIPYTHRERFGGIPLAVVSRQSGGGMYFPKLRLSSLVGFSYAATSSGNPMRSLSRFCLSAFAISLSKCAVNQLPSPWSILSMFCLSYSVMLLLSYVSPILIGKFIRSVSLLLPRRSL